MNRVSKISLSLLSILAIGIICLSGGRVLAVEGEEGGSDPAPANEGTSEGGNTGSSDTGSDISGESSGGGDYSDAGSAGESDGGTSIVSPDIPADPGVGCNGDNCGGEQGTENFDTEGGYGESGQSAQQQSSGNTGDVSKYTFSSRSTGVSYFTVTEKGQTVHARSLCTTASCSSDHFAYIPDKDINTGDAAVGSKYYYLGIYAQNSGWVYLDGVRTHVEKGELLTYIPFGGIGADGNSWSIFNVRGNYGSLKASDVIAIYNQMVALGLIEDVGIDKIGAFGGMEEGDYLKKLDKGKVKDLLCEVNCNKEPEPEPISCHIGTHAGWTEGKAQVTNMTTGTGWTGLVWARPGDTVRFKIDYCWGAQAVGGSLGNSSGPWAINDEGIAQTNADSFTSGQNIGKEWFRISASKGNGYLFGENEQYIGSSTHTLTKPHNTTIGPATEEQVPNEYVDSTGDYAFVVLSPSTKGVDADRYNCSIFDFSAFTITNGHGYQIPGVGTGSCGAISGNGGNMNDAGSSFSQTITYQNITAWQQWKHNERGGCYGCTHAAAQKFIRAPQIHTQPEVDNLVENNPKVKADPFRSVAEARGGAGNEWGLIEKHANSKDEFGTPTNGDCDESSCSALSWEHWVVNGCHYCNGYDYYDDTKTEYWPDGTYKGTIVTCHNCRHCRDAWRSCYLDCTGGSCNSNHRISSQATTYFDPQYNYTTAAQNLGTQSSTATVNVPYSYRTSTTSTIQEGDVIYLGETVNSLFTASIIPRVVSEVRPGEAYATVVPGYIKAVEFVVDANSSLSPATGSSNAGGSDPCSYYGSLGMISGCNTIWEEHGAGGYLNEEGRYAGKTYSSGSVTRVVPDTYPVGSKYCVAVGISTSDSHSQPDTQVVSGMSNISGWRISNLSCRTIAKKPNFQIWNGNFYTKGGIQTSITVKRVGANLGDPSDPTGYFGSWEEYVISAKGKVQGMSSGAGLGYYGGYNDKSLGLQGGTSPSSSFCKLSRMTISNSNCGQGVLGDYFTGNSLIEDSAATVLERIRSRYLSSTHGITQLENGATYIYPEQGSIKTSELASIAHGALSNTQLSSTVIRQTKSAINSESEQTTRNYASNALIIHVDGTLTIDTDICTGTGTCGSSNDLVLGNRNSDYYDNIYSLPQVLIIADGGIVVSDRVTQIDAWLITNGNINTCNGLNASSGSFSASTCGNQLIVNGPVFANSLTPVRNSGANGGVGSGNSGGNPIYYNLTDDGSIQPAEIFNLRPDVLYWAYSQAQRFSQANVTYTRELAPRY